MADPVDAYRKQQNDERAAIKREQARLRSARWQQGLAPVTQSSDPVVVAWTRRAAAATGADPVALLATALQESGARRGAIGDGGTSFGPWQMHQGGALGNHNAAWANSYATALNRAQEFARLKVHTGVGAAAVQRPADRALYARGVDSFLDQARAILGASAPIPAHAAPATVKAVTAQPVTDAPSAAQRAALLQGMLADASAPDLLSLVQQAPGASAPATVKPAVSSPGRGAPQATAAAPNNEVTQLAKKYLGTPYVWGGAKPGGFDCSGLLQYVWGQAGVSIPRTTYQQIKAGKPVATNALQPGDAIFFGSAKNPHHVGMYLGDGKFIEAPHTGANVRVSNLAGRTDIVAARRYK